MTSSVKCPYKIICKWEEKKCQEYTSMYDCSIWTYFNGHIKDNLAEIMEEKYLRNLERLLKYKDLNRRES